MTSMRLIATILLVHGAILISPDHIKAQTSPSAALAGQVSSQEEGPMEGVMISAKREGSTVTITVGSDAQGRYSFPRARLEPGRYSLRIRASGYDLSDPGPVEVTANKPSQLDLKLVKTKDLAAQLTNAEWLMSVPGTLEQKTPMLGCSGCHTLERIVRSHYSADELRKLVQRMRTYHEGTIPGHPQISPGTPQPDRELDFWGLKTQLAEFDYIASINLSAVPQWKYPLETLPRPKGKATRVIITEYDLPRPFTMPHDAGVDREGMVWYCDDAQQYIGRLDPKTAKVVEYPVPVLRQGAPNGCRDIYFDREGNPWMALQSHGGIGKFDKKTEEFQTWSPPADPDRPNQSVIGVQPRYQNVDGKVWIYGGGGIRRLDVATSEWGPLINVYDSIPKDSPAAKGPHGYYDIFTDSRNNVYFADFRSETAAIGKLDAKTLKVTFYPTPTPHSYPRRATMDKQDRLWFGEFVGNKIGMLDTKAGRIQEWPMPTPFGTTYDVAMDKNGYAWTAGMTSDRVARLNTKTGEIVEFLLPRTTNIRRVNVDDSTNPPSFWVGNNHGSSLVRVEALEP